MLTRNDVPYPVATVHNAGIVRHNDRYIMLFMSHLLNARSIIGRADSEDGFSFTVHPRPFLLPSAEGMERSRGAYGLVARRDAAMLNTVFPPQMPVVRLRIRYSLADVGWACVVLRDFTATGETPFGALRVGLIADALAEPGDARGVIAAATEHLKRAHADLLFSNQAHPAWTDALRAEGFVTGPSQFAFYRLPQMDAALGPLAARSGYHLNRGDCDGPLSR